MYGLVLDLIAPNLELVELNVSGKDIDDARKVKVLYRICLNCPIDFFNLRGWSDLLTDFGLNVEVLQLESSSNALRKVHRTAIPKMI